MHADDDKLLVYFDGEQHLVRRLGAAVVSCWKELDADTRAKLIARAERVLDEEMGEAVTGDLRRFLTVHDGPSADGDAGAARAPSPTPR